MLLTLELVLQVVTQATKVGHSSSCSEKCFQDAESTGTLKIHDS